jgi:transcription elongation factor Elf1
MTFRVICPDCRQKHEVDVYALLHNTEVSCQFCGARFDAISETLIMHSKRDQREVRSC